MGDPAIFLKVLHVIRSWQLLKQILQSDIDIATIAVNRMPLLSAADRVSQDENGGITRQEMQDS